MIRVVTFDLDDTLWSVGPALAAAEAEQWAYLDAELPGIADRFPPERLRALRHAVLTATPTLRHHISRFRKQLIEQLLMEDGLAAEAAAAMAATAFTVFLEARHRVTVFPEAPAVLATLSERYRLGALTNGNADVFRTPLGEYFDFAFRAEEIGSSKPAPDLFQSALAHTGIHATEMVHVGDSHDHDVEGARAAGVRAVWLTTSANPGHGATATIAGLDELPVLLDALSRDDDGFNQ